MQNITFTAHKIQIFHLCHMKDEPGLLFMKEHGTESASFLCFVFIILKLTPQNTYFLYCDICMKTLRSTL